VTLLSDFVIIRRKYLCLINPTLPPVIGTPEVVMGGFTFLDVPKIGERAVLDTH